MFLVLLVSGVLIHGICTDSRRKEEPEQKEQGAPEAFEQAKEKDTIEAYQKWLAKHHNGPEHKHGNRLFAAEAERRLEELKAEEKKLVMEEDTVERYMEYQRLLWRRDHQLPDADVRAALRKAFPRERNVHVHYTRQGPDLHCRFLDRVLEECYDAGICDLVINVSVEAKALSAYYGAQTKLYTGGILSGVVEMRDANTNTLLKREEFRFEDPVDSILKYRRWDNLEQHYTPDRVLSRMCVEEMMPFIRGIVGKVRDSSRDTGAYDYERAVRGAERAEKSPRPVASSAQPRGE